MPRFYRRLESPPTRLAAAPRLASWNRVGDPDQSRLAVALAGAETQLADELAEIAPPLALSLDVGVPAGRDLLGHHDLDNYLYPIVQHLMMTPNRDFLAVWGSKSHADHSWVRVGTAQPLEGPPMSAISMATTASADTAAYKKQIFDHLSGAQPIAGGAVALEIAFVVGPRRNWINLWKPTIDALGALLGTDSPSRPWSPRDGRITSLGLHCTVDPDAGHGVRIALTAGPAEAPRG